MLEESEQKPVKEESMKRRLARLNDFSDDLLTSIPRYAFHYKPGRILRMNVQIENSNRTRFYIAEYESVRSGKYSLWRFAGILD
jgi:hypothetical protein